MSAAVRVAPWAILALVILATSGAAAALAGGGGGLRPLRVHGPRPGLRRGGRDDRHQAPRNPIGWLFCATGLVWAIELGVNSYAYWALRERVSLCLRPTGDAR